MPNYNPLINPLMMDPQGLLQKAREARNWFGQRMQQVPEWAMQQVDKIPQQGYGLGTNIQVAREQPSLQPVPHGAEWINSLISDILNYGPMAGGLGGGIGMVEEVGQGLSKGLKAPKAIAGAGQKAKSAKGIKSAVGGLTEAEANYMNQKLGESFGEIFQPGKTLSQTVGENQLYPMTNSIELEGILKKMPGRVPKDILEAKIMNLEKQMEELHKIAKSTELAGGNTTPIERAIDALDKEINKLEYGYK